MRQTGIQIGHSSSYVGPVVPRDRYHDFVKDRAEIINSVTEWWRSFAMITGRNCTFLDASEHTIQSETNNSFSQAAQHHLAGVWSIGTRRDSLPHYASNQLRPPFYLVLRKRQMSNPHPRQYFRLVRTTLHISDTENSTLLGSVHLELSHTLNVGLGKDLRIENQTPMRELRLIRNIFPVYKSWE